MKSDNCEKLLSLNISFFPEQHRLSFLLSVQRLSHNGDHEAESFTSEEILIAGNVFLNFSVVVEQAEGMVHNVVVNSDFGPRWVGEERGPFVDRWEILMHFRTV